eukprot:TRINITY_DN99_c0_g1_i1.p1 TRINITY_DN99_c0_g1~~TRINITY_DN99_c0_g1_i1.p1  ORF type:complete len:405 (+),score=122.22 TRINITY_DN99_c0_g1_i1:69-1283(+)
MDETVQKRITERLQRLSETSHFDDESVNFVDTHSLSYNKNLITPKSLLGLTSSCSNDENLEIDSPIKMESKLMNNNPTVSPRLHSRLFHKYTELKKKYEEDMCSVSLSFETELEEKTKIIKEKEKEICRLQNVCLVSETKLKNFIQKNNVEKKGLLRKIDELENELLEFQMKTKLFGFSSDNVHPLTYDANYESIKEINFIIDMEKDEVNRKNVADVIIAKNKLEMSSTGSENSEKLKILSKKIFELEKIASINNKTAVELRKLNDKLEEENNFLKKKLQFLNVENMKEEELKGLQSSHQKSSNSQSNTHTNHTQTEESFDDQNSFVYVEKEHQPKKEKDNINTAIIEFEAEILNLNTQIQGYKKTELNYHLLKDQYKLLEKKHLELLNKTQKYLMQIGAFSNT